MKQLNIAMKAILAGLLCLTLTLTGLGLDHTTVVTAAEKQTADAFPDGETITMKPGDVKRLVVTEINGEEFEDDGGLRWTSSDESIVTYNETLVDSDNGDDRYCIELTALKAGTVTIKGVYNTPDFINGKFIWKKVTLTINVKKPAMTAKQKKCSHKWKTTKTATCQRTGIKTCTKCKLQKTIQIKDHKYVEKKCNNVSPKGSYYVRQCNHTNEERKMLDCSFATKIKTIINQATGEMTITDDSEYKSYDEMMEPFTEHGKETGHVGGYTEYYDSWGTVRWTCTEGICKWCGKGDGNKQNVKILEESDK